MFNEIKVNGEYLPRPDEDLVIKNKKVKTEYETEAGTTQVSVTRASKITISGSWTLTGKWMQKFRNWEEADTVKVSVFFPSYSVMSDHECQLSIDSENHKKFSREQLSVGGIYEISVTMEEL